MMSVQKFPFSAFLCCTISWSKFLLPCYRKKKFCSSTTSSRLFLSTRKKMLLFCYHNYRDKFCSCSATSFPTRETPLLPQLQNDLHIYHIFPTRERISSTTTYSWKTWWELIIKVGVGLTWSSVQNNSLSKVPHHGVLQRHTTEAVSVRL